MNQSAISKFQRIRSFHSSMEDDTLNSLTFIDQVLMLVSLKLIDEEESKIEQNPDIHKSLFPLQTSRFLWKNWSHMTGKDLFSFIENEVIPYMSSLISDSPQIANYFNGSSITINNMHMLEEIVDLIGSIEFRELGIETKNEIVNCLTTDLDSENSDKIVQVSKNIRELMLNMASPRIGDAMLDPVCGIGSLLSDSIRSSLADCNGTYKFYSIYGIEETHHIEGNINAKSKENLKSDTFLNKKTDMGIDATHEIGKHTCGIEHSKQLWRISRVILILHGMHPDNIVFGNTLAKSNLLANSKIWNKKYDLIISDTRLASLPNNEGIRDDLPDANFNPERLVLELAMNSLEIGGRCAILVPLRILTRTQRSYFELRKSLILDFELLAIVLLPQKTATYFKLENLILLVFQKPQQVQPNHERNVCFFDISHNGHWNGKPCDTKFTELTIENDTDFVLEQWNNYRKSNFGILPGVEANSVLEPNDKNQNCWWVSEYQIAGNNFNLNPERYKPTIAEETAMEDPTQIVQNLLENEKQIFNELVEIRKKLQ